MRKRGREREKGKREREKGKRRERKARGRERKARGRETKARGRETKARGRETKARGRETKARAGNLRERVLLSGHKPATEMVCVKGKRCPTGRLQRHKASWGLTSTLEVLHFKVTMTRGPG